MTVRTVGIVGCGVIGGALKVWIEKNTPHKVLVSDPPKGFNVVPELNEVFRGK